MRTTLPFPGVYIHETPSGTHAIAGIVYSGITKYSNS